MPLILPIPTVEIDPNNSRYSPNKKRRKSDDHQHDRDMLHNFFMISKNRDDNIRVDFLFKKKCLTTKQQAYIYAALRINNKALTFNTMDKYLDFLSRIIAETMSHLFEDNIPTALDNFLKSYVKVTEIFDIIPEAEEKSGEISTLEALVKSEHMGQNAHIKGNAAVNGTEIFDIIPEAEEKSGETSTHQKLEESEKLEKIAAEKMFEENLRLRSDLERADDQTKKLCNDIQITITEGKESDTIHGPEEKTQNQPISNDQNKNHDFILAMCLTLLALSCVMLYWVPIKLLLVKIIPLPQLSSFLMSTTGNAISKILFGLVVLLPMMLLSYQNNNSAPLPVVRNTDHNFAQTTEDEDEAFDRVTGKQAKHEEKFNNDKPGNKA